MVWHREPYAALEAIQPTAAGKYVLITNASSNIGRSIALSWARARAAGIAICCRNAEELQSVTTEIRLINSVAQVIAMTCDTTRSFDIKEIFSATKETFGQLDVVIANVGQVHLEATNEADDNDMWWADSTANFRSTHLPAHQYIRTFGPSLTGTFISITSGAELVVSPGVSSHKFAQFIDRRLVEFLTLEYPQMKAFSLDVGAMQPEPGLRTHSSSTNGKLELVGRFSVWLGGGRADTLRGNQLCAEWDVRELELNI